MSAEVRTQWQGLARRFVTAGREERRSIWREVDVLAPHLSEPDATATFYGLVAATKREDLAGTAEALDRLTGTAAAR